METNRAGQRLADKYKKLQTKINTYRERIIEADKNLQRGTTNYKTRQSLSKTDKNELRLTKASRGRP